MHLVQQHGGDANQAGVGQQTAHQQSLGDDLDAGGGGYRRVEARAVANGLADLFTKQGRHPCCGGAGGKAARLQDQDPGVATPPRVQHGERHKRGLARAGRGDQHSVAPGGKASNERGERLGDRQVGEGWHSANP